MSWDALDKVPSGGGEYLKMEAGDTLEMVFRGPWPPHSFYKKFPDKTEHKDWAEGRSFRFKVPVVVKDGDAFVPKIWEQGVTVARMLRDVHEEYDGFDNVFKVKRTGSTKDDTTYSILFKRKLEGGALEKIEAIDIPVLGKKNSPIASAEGFNDPPPPDNSDVPF